MSLLSDGIPLLDLVYNLLELILYIDVHVWLIFVASSIIFMLCKNVSYANGKSSRFVAAFLGDLFSSKYKLNLLCCIE